MSTPIERVQEYIRQAELATRPPVEVIHGIYSDPNAEMADLTLVDLKEALADVWAEGAQDASLHWGAPEVGTAELLKENPYRKEGR